MSKCLPIWDQMPPEIMEKIVGFTDNMDKLRLRQCCRYFQKIVNSSEMVIDNLSITWNYQRNLFSVCVSPPGILKRLLEDSDVSQLEYHLKTVLNCHPKLRIKELKIEMNPKTFVGKNDTWQLILERKKKHGIIDRLKSIFSKFENKFLIEHFHMVFDENGADFLQFLQYFQPETLHTIYMDFVKKLTPQNGFLQFDLSKIAETEQFKRAKSISVPRVYLPFCRRETAHFASMTYRIRVLHVEEVEYTVRNIIRANGWQRREICFSQVDFDEIREYLTGNFEILKREDEEKDPKLLDVTVRRDGYKCSIRSHQESGSMVFWNNEVDTESSVF